MSESIGFLIGDVSRLIRRRFDDRARSLGSSRAQWKTLLILSRNQGINQGQLAELLEVEPITLSRMIDRLEEAGLVERRRDPADRRAWRVFLTTDADPILRQLRAHADDLTEAAFAGLDGDDRAHLTASLARIRENLLHPDFARETAHG
jgi:DNA-binding MarR family transcriptional regulator